MSRLNSIPNNCNGAVITFFKNSKKKKKLFYDVKMLQIENLICVKLLQISQECYIIVESNLLKSIMKDNKAALYH